MSKASEYTKAAVPPTLIVRPINLSVQPWSIAHVNNDGNLAIEREVEARHIPALIEWLKDAFL